jgi:16S rRNA (cytosine967-C5)-methyltransferase
VPRTSPRDCALDVLRVAAAEHRFADVVLDERLSAAGLSAADRALATELVYGVTRRRLTLDWLIEGTSSRPLAKLDARLRPILQVALYQLLYMDKVPAYAAVNEAVEAAKRDVHAGAAKFANAVLRAVLRAKDHIAWPAADEDLVEHLAVVHSHPRWLVRRWLAHFGRDETSRVCAADNLPPPVTLRANRIKVSRDDLVEHLCAEGLDAEADGGDEAAVRVHAPGSLDALAAYARGEFYVQDVTAMSVARLLDPRPGERILDLCAAPGGKATHCAELMDDAGRVVACDLDEKRLDTLRANAARLGLSCVETARCDARDVPQLITPASFDRVLLDAPCTNTGVLRRRAEARWRIEENDVARHSARQAELLDAAAAMVRPGGVLVYGTCSIEPEENDRAVRRFLSRHGEFKLDREALVLPAAAGGDGGYMARLGRAD